MKLTEQRNCNVHRITQINSQTFYDLFDKWSFSLNEEKIVLKLKGVFYKPMPLIWVYVFIFGSDDQDDSFFIFITGAVYFLLKEFVFGSWAKNEWSMKDKKPKQ